MSAALVPVKGLAAGKSRLLPHLPRETLAALCLAMLEDLLEALAATSSVTRSAVVTPDPQVADTARRAGARVFLGPDPGLNPAIEAAAPRLCPGAGDPLLVVLGDVAGARPGDFEALFESLAAQGGRGVVLAPSDDGGTSALLRAPHDAIPARFGTASAKRHRQAAERAGVPFCERYLAGLAIDLDLAEDVDRFLESGGAGARTRALLGTLARSTAT